MSMIHDLWTSINNHCIIGSSIKFTIDDILTHTIACFLLKQNTSHKAKDVADQLQHMYMERYEIDLKNDAAFVGSDTTPCACNVADEIGCTQNDCEMHVISLIISYAIGHKENYKTETKIDKVSRPCLIIFIEIIAEAPIFIHYMNKTGRQRR